MFLLPCTINELRWQQNWSKIYQSQPTHTTFWTCSSKLVSWEVHFRRWSAAAKCKTVHWADFAHYWKAMQETNGFDPVLKLMVYFIFIHPSGRRNLWQNQEWNDMQKRNQGYASKHRFQLLNSLISHQDFWWTVLHCATECRKLFSFLHVCRWSKVDQLDVKFVIQNDILIL